MPPPEYQADAANGAEALVQLLVAQGVEHVFLNPGTDTAPIQEAIVALAERDLAVPRVHLCPDEQVALSAAQGYWLRTGVPQAVIVHVDVGTQGLGPAVHNAQRTNSGVVIIAGKAPRTFDDELPGGRTIAVHWQQDQLDPIGIVRGFVKWAEEITLPESFATLVPRAFQVARSGPAGPTFLLVAREILMREMSGVRVLPPARRPAAISPAPCPEAIARLAEWLLRAERPLLLTGRLGRNPAAVARLAELAELVALPVADAREYLNLPSDHPCYVADDAAAAELFRNADLVIVVDTEVPWVPLNRTPPETARIAQIDLDPVKPAIVNWSFPVDLAIQADSAKALPALTAAVRAVATAADEARWDRRRMGLEDAATRRAEAAGAAQPATPINPVAVVQALNTVLTDAALVLEEVTTNDIVVREHLRRRLPGSIHAIGAAGLGWAPAAAIGAKLAEPDRDVVALVGDGSFVFSKPVATLWAARHAGAPFLTVIFDNQGYRAAKLPVVGLFPEGASVRLGDFTGTEISDPPDYAAIAEACGATGIRVEEPGSLAGELERAMAVVRAGRCAVVDVALEPI